MNTMTKKITLGLLVIGFLAGSLVWAGSEEHSRREHRGGKESCSRMEEHRGEHKGEHRSKHRMKKHGMRMNGMQKPGMHEMQKLFQEDMRTNHAEVLAELSGKPVGEIRSQLETRSLRAVMEEYGLKHEQVQPLLQARMTTMVSKAVESKRITQGEANRMQARMGNAGQGCKGGEHSKHSEDS